MLIGVVSMAIASMSASDLCQRYISLLPATSLEECLALPQTMIAFRISGCLRDDSWKLKVGTSGLQPTDYICKYPADPRLGLAEKVEVVTQKECLARNVGPHVPDSPFFEWKSGRCVAYGGLLPPVSRQPVGDPLPPPLPLAPSRPHTDGPTQ